MGKYFGTDGVRGEANVELTPELAFKTRSLWRLCPQSTRDRGTKSFCRA